MLGFKNKDYYIKYSTGLLNAAKDGKTKEYMESNSDPEVYFLSSFDPNYTDIELSAPY